MTDNVLILQNAGAGPDNVTLDKIAEKADIDAVLLILLRDHFCLNCREEVQELAERYDEFEERNAMVVAVLPEPLERAENWQEKYNLPFPLLADPNKELGQVYGQPQRFGIIGKLHDLIGRMPQVLLFNTSTDNPELAYTYEGSTPSDRPTIDTLLHEIDKLDTS
jgi:peroxiredoxin Q/BCP